VIATIAKSAKNCIAVNAHFTVFIGGDVNCTRVNSPMRLGWVSGATFYRAGEKHSTYGEYEMSALKRFLKNEDGVTAIEYGLIAALIGVAIITAVGLVGSSLNTTFGKVSTQLSGAT
jgi:pilus assembly protein Flp/PilA